MKTKIKAIGEEDYFRIVGIAGRGSTTVTVRVSEVEYEMIKEEAKKKNCTVPHYLRWVCIYKHLAEVALCEKINNSINRKTPAKSQEEKSE